MLSDLAACSDTALKAELARLTKSLDACETDADCGRFETDFGPAAVTHVNLNDGVVEGLRLLDAPAFSVQYHPEAAPGTHDAVGLFGEFCDLMDRAR